MRRDSGYVERSAALKGLAVSAAALVFASSAIASLPRTGVFLPGRSLGGIRLGQTEGAVRATLGSHGVCIGCATSTWYFNYKPFNQRGLAVEFKRGLVSAVYTLWQPQGWHAPKGLRLGAVDAQLTSSTGPLVSVVCQGYDARVADGPKARSVYYVVQGKLWGFGLLRAQANPCR
jgi:hypothetical protein